MTDADSAGSFATLTHARLRATQGDLAGSARILQVILQAQPGHREARRLLDTVRDRRVERLTGWIEKARRNRRRPGVR